MLVEMPSALRTVRWSRAGPAEAGRHVRVFVVSLRTLRALRWSRKRGLRAQIDTSTGDEIHVAAFKSYHTTTPNGYNLQVSYVTKENRLALPNAVRPKPPAAK